MVDKENYKILYDIESPKDIRDFDTPQLKLLCSEIREYMVDVVSEVGGHFGGGLGTVELTVALHKVFNTPEDSIVWDTGHQAYPHKIITGRRDTLNTIRQFKGLSGFLKRSESEYDDFKVELSAGEIIFIGTDGIWEARNSTDEMFGRKRMDKIIMGNGYFPAVRIVFQTLDTFQIGQFNFKF